MTGYQVFAMVWPLVVGAMVIASILIANRLDRPVQGDQATATTAPGTVDPSIAKAWQDLKVAFEAATVEAGKVQTATKDLQRATTKG